MSVGASSTIHDNISVSSEEGRSRAPSHVDKLNEVRTNILLLFMTVIFLLPTRGGISVMTL